MAAHPLLLSQFARLRSMPREELAFRVRGAVRTQTQRVSVAVRGARWDRSHIVHALAPSALDREARKDADRGEWAAVEARLQRALLDRPSRFVLDPHSASTLRDAITRRWPDAPCRAAAAGNAILAGRYNLLAFEGLAFGSDGAAIDWHFDPVHGRRAPEMFFADVPYLDAACGDHKIIWELNRHQHFLALGRALWLTGDARYASRIRTEVQSWLMANPPLIGVNWASVLEVGFRSISWIAALHFLLAHNRSGDDDRADAGADGSLLDLFIALDRQLTHVEHNLSRYFSPNTHLLGEALALYVAGVALPELAHGWRWIDTGRGVLLAEAERQIARDGGHIERSTYYHRYALDFYTLAMIAAEQAGDIEAAAVFGDAVERLAEFLLALTDDHGRIPQIGDDDGGVLWPLAGRDPLDVRDSLAVAALLVGRRDLAPWGVPEEAVWITARVRPEVLDGLTWGKDCRERSALSAHAFPDTGYVTVHTPSHDHLVFDVGEHGYLNGGHAHTDALALTLTVGGVPLLIDPGTATYTMDPQVRDRMRASTSHNTLTLDGVSAAIPAGAFQWKTRAHARLEHWQGGVGCVMATASHDAYSPIRHRRTVIHSAHGGWLIVDHLLGSGDHQAAFHWHFAPAWHVVCEDQLIEATDGEGRRAWIVHTGHDLRLACGDGHSGLGWCSPRYGALRPTWTARVSRAGRTPFSMATWIGEGDAPPSLEEITLDEHGAMPIVVRVHRAKVRTTTLVSREPEHRGEYVAMAADCRTDARLLQYTEDGCGLSAVSMIGCGHVVATRNDLLSASADAIMADCDVTLVGDRLQLSSTAPPPYLRLQGRIVERATTVWLNGREWQDRSAQERGTIGLPASAWGTRAGHEAGRTLDGTLTCAVSQASST